MKAHIENVSFWLKNIWNWLRLETSKKKQSGIVDISK